jgi:hypothetical protein
MEEIKKYTCKCESCDRKFDEEEYEITQDENKCILHCEKIDWFDIHDDNVLWNKKYCNFFWMNINNLIDKVNKERDENLDYEKEIKYDFNYDIFYYEFNEILFPDFDENEKELEKLPFKNLKELDIFFNKCKFIGNSNFRFLHKSKNILFSECEFLQETMFYNLSINEKFIFTKNIVVDEVYFYNCKFNDIVSFSDSIFYSKINLEHCYFKEFVDFSNLKSSYLNLKTNLFEKKINFLNLDIINFENRETVRIIKDSFEQQNNIIEANKFYALEMKEREKELKQDREEGKNFFEWLVFKIHGLSSNHSQDWVLSLFWILSFSFGYSFMSCVNSHLDTKLEYILTDAFIYIFVIYTSILIINYKKMNKFYLTGLFYILYVYLSKDFTLQTFSNNLNPFSIMTEFSQLNFSTMIYKITIAYLIYQLIISIRQNTRRK